MTISGEKPTIDFSKLLSRNDAIKENDDFAIMHVSKNAPIFAITFVVRLFSALPEFFTV